MLGGEKIGHVTAWAQEAGTDLERPRASRASLIVAISSHAFPSNAASSLAVLSRAVANTFQKRWQQLRRLAVAAVAAVLVGESGS